MRSASSINQNHCFYEALGRRNIETKSTIHSDQLRASLGKLPWLGVNSQPSSMLTAGNG